MEKNKKLLLGAFLVLTALILLGRLRTGLVELQVAPLMEHVTREIERFEQNARAALQVADYGYVLETGEVVLEGPAADLIGNPRVIESYLGLGNAGRERG